MEPNSPPVRRWNPWPVSIVAFFTLAIIGCVSFVAFCSLHPSELVAPDYYEQELRFQARMDSKEHARQLGSQASVTYDPLARVIRVSVPGPPLNPLGTIQLYRPSAAGLDRQLPLKLDRAGRQDIGAAALEPGPWKVRVSWHAGGRDYFLDERVVVDPSTGPARAP
jgi:nitrogen fixation protein FixH